MNDLNPIAKPLDHLTEFGQHNSVALITRDQSLDYSVFERAVGRLAAALLARGLVAGDRVASWLPKTIETCLLPLAVARAGMIYVPVNPALRRAQVEHILTDSGAKLLITAKARAETLDKTCPILLDSDARLAWSEGEALPPSDHDPDTLCAILYTSGSTGRPKGVMLSHANLWLGAISVASYLKLRPDDRVLGVLPLSFDYGQNQLLSALAAGASYIPQDYLAARDVIKAVDRHDATVLAGVPPLWLQLTEAQWPAGTAEKLRLLTNSGGALTVPLIKAMQSKFPNAAVTPMYGLTEAFRSTWLDSPLVDAHPTSMGRAIPFAEILVVRPDGSSTQDDEPGELVHAGPLVAKGYWQDSERTARRFKAAPSQSIYGGTAVWSGDTVRRDAAGLHYFVGRDDEMIKASGNRISPTEIEEAAIASGAVAEAVAFGIADERLGQAIILVARPISDKAEEQLIRWFKAEQPSFMMPKQIILRQSLPRNANGKLDRSGIKADYQS